MTQTGRTTSEPQSAPLADLPPFLRAQEAASAAPDTSVAPDAPATPDRGMRMPRFRLLPAVMVFACLLFALKVMNIAATAADLMANEGQGAGADGAASGEGRPAEDTLEAVALEAQVLAAETMAEGAAAPASDMAFASTDFRSRSEVGLLQDLAARRQELNRLADELDTRERLLMATERRIDGKIERLKAIEAQIKQLIHMHNEQEEAQLASLVKVYETMKPKEAAAILEKLEMDVLLRVVQRMNNRKLALILAQMDPEIAKKVTVEMATHRELPPVEG